MTNRKLPQLGEILITFVQIKIVKNFPWLKFLSSFGSFFLFFVFLLFVWCFFYVLMVYSSVLLFYSLFCFYFLQILIAYLRHCQLVLSCGGRSSQAEEWWLPAVQSSYGVQHQPQGANNRHTSAEFTERTMGIVTFYHAWQVLHLTVFFFRLQ